MLQENSNEMFLDKLQWKHSWLFVTSAVTILFFNERSILIDFLEILRM